MDSRTTESPREVRGPSFSHTDKASILSGLSDATNSNITQLRSQINQWKPYSLG